MSKWQSVEAIAQQVQAGQLRAVDLIARSLSTIEQHKEFNAVLAVVADRARLRAKEIDAAVDAGKKVGKLAGVPFLAKDNFLTFGSPTTAGSNILKGFEAPYQATAINKLEAEGAICVAKANLDAFGHGTSSENSDYMVTKNPHNPEHVPGGSSSGSAAGVILEMAPFAVGTDTGGSIRQPASFCGAVGLKPTYGLVSRSGVVAMISSTDTIGPLARTVEDCAYVLDVMAGKDALDGTTIERDPEPYTVREDVGKAKVGIIKEYMGNGTTDGVVKAINEATNKMKAAGIVVEGVSLPSLPLALACYYIIAPAEISSNLSRYDGQKYGHSSQQATNLDDSYNWSRSEGFGTEAKRRIIIGAYVLSSGYYDAYYLKAQKLRTKLIDDFADAFSKYDYLVGPVAPTTAFKIGKNSDDPLSMYLQDIMTVAPSLVGIPGISVPVGADEHGLPVGMQILAAQKQDRKLLSMAKKVEEIL